MGPPGFKKCSICGKEFGSASIDIHVPQCYEKAMATWEKTHSGPQPVLPQKYGGTGGGSRAPAGTAKKKTPASKPAKRSGGPQFEIVGGGGGGGGATRGGDVRVSGGGKILRDNTSSQGMLEAMGRA